MQKNDPHVAMSGTTDVNDPENNLPDLQEDDIAEVITLDEQAPLNNDGDDDSDDNTQHGTQDGNQMQDVDEDQNTDTSVPARDDALVVLRAHTSDALTVSASPSDVSRVVSGGMDDIAVIWDLNLRAPVATVDDFGDSVSTTAFSHDGQCAALGSENGSVFIVFFDGSLSPSAQLNGPGDTVRFLTWHPRGPILLAGSDDHVAYMWNAPKAKFLMAFAGHEGPVTCGDFTADGKQVVTASQDTSLRIWNPSTGQVLVRIQMGQAGLRSHFHSSQILCLSVGCADTMADKLVATGCDNGDVFISHRESGHVVAQLPRHDGSVECVAFAPSSVSPVMLVTAASDGVIRVWDVEKSIERCKFVHGEVIAKVMWHRHYPVLVSGASDGMVKIWNVLTTELIVELSGHQSFITDLCFTTDQRNVLSSSADGTIRLFDVDSIIKTAVGAGATT